MSDELAPGGRGNGKIVKITRIHGVDPADGASVTLDAGEGGTWTAVGTTADGVDTDAVERPYDKGGILPGPQDITLTIEMDRTQMLERFAQLGRMIGQVGRGFRFTSVGPWTMNGAAPGRSGPRPWYVKPVTWAARRRIDSLRRRRRRRGVGRPGTTVTRTTVVPNLMLDSVDGARYRFRAKTPAHADAMRHAMAVLDRWATDDGRKSR